MITRRRQMLIAVFEDAADFDADAISAAGISFSLRAEPLHFRCRYAEIEATPRRQPAAADADADYAERHCYAASQLSLRATPTLIMIDIEDSFFIAFIDAE